MSADATSTPPLAPPPSTIPTGDPVMSCRVPQEHRDELVRVGGIIPMPDGERSRMSVALRAILTPTLAPGVMDRILALQGETLSDRLRRVLLAGLAACEAADKQVA